MKLQATVAFAALIGLMMTAGCAGHGPDSPAAPQVTNPSLVPATVPDLSEMSTPALLNEATGMAEGVLGIYWLNRDPQDPTHAELSLARTGAAAQGDLYLLSARPYMGPQHLTLLGTAAGPNNTTDYTFRFTHPFPMPVDLAGPPTAAKRVDLFIFDVTMVLAAGGGQPFFDFQFRAQVDAMTNPNGYRQLGPMIDHAAMGITDGTSVFPYKLLLGFDPGDPDGNYDTDGWVGPEFLNPSGYDVVPQGKFLDSTMRISNAIAQPLPIVVTAKYMDPRGGVTALEKRGNRLPGADPALLRYFLPEACGDIQNITASTAGTLYANSSADTGTITLNILDWDNSATVAGSWPDFGNLKAIRELSQPADIAASFPALKATGDFSGTAGTPTGVLNEFVPASITINNVTQGQSVPPGGQDVVGLVRIRDTQDLTAPEQILLDESLHVQPKPSWYEPSTRWQRVQIKVMPAPPAPDITAVSPLTGLSGASVQFSATNAGGAVGTWTWGFGGGATPNIMNVASPTVVLGTPGDYAAVCQAQNGSGTDSFFFTLHVDESGPNITSVTPLSGFGLRSTTFSAVNAGPAATSWDWQFGTAATPATSTAASPVVVLNGRAGVYDCSVTASNAGGQMTFPFQVTVSYKFIGLRMTVIKNGAQYPSPLYGMAAGGWSEANFKTWVDTRINNVYRDTGVQFALDQVDYIERNDPALFNIDTQNELDTLWGIALNGNPNKLNSVAINALPSSPGLGGVMTDTSCNPNNSGRGCWIICWGQEFDIVVLPHELGHVMNLPHVRTSSPINSNNFNLMSYGTTSTVLFTNATREEAASCINWSGNPHNQFQVVNNWVYQYM